MKLYEYRGDYFSRKLAVAANYAGVDLERIYMELSELKTPEFLKKNPNGKLPVLETPEGVHIFESNAILRYIARLDKTKGLYGSDILEESHVDQWLDWFVNEVSEHYFPYIAPYLGWFGDKKSSKAAESKLRPALKILDDHLKLNTFVAGNKVTIADINMMAELFIGFRFLWDEKWRKSIPNITRWFETLVAQEPFAKEYGRIMMCQKPLEIPNLQ